MAALPASRRMEPGIGPIHGDHPAANARPRAALRQRPTPVVGSTCAGAPGATRNYAGGRPCKSEEHDQDARDVAEQQEVRAQEHAGARRSAWATRRPPGGSIRSALSSTVSCGRRPRLRRYPCATTGAGVSMPLLFLNVRATVARVVPVRASVATTRTVNTANAVARTGTESRTVSTPPLVARTV